MKNKDKFTDKSIHTTLDESMVSQRKSGSSLIENTVGREIK
jgi:hypothetical protein